MRISELADRTGVSVPTLKYYLREGLLHAGEAQSATRAAYDEGHVERVRLVRTLVEVGRLSIDRVREVVEALDHPPQTRHELLGAAHLALRAATSAEAAPDEAMRLRLAALGMPDCDGSQAGLQLGQALTAAEACGWPVSDSTLSVWHAAMRSVAETDVVRELADVPAAEALRYAILGTVLTDPILVALRRVAQEQVSAERFGDAGAAGPPVTPSG
jgi:DNA-binding transcriptional MerR regulator